MQWNHPQTVTPHRPGTSILDSPCLPGEGVPDLDGLGHVLEESNPESLLILFIRLNQIGHQADEGKTEVRWGSHDQSTKLLKRPTVQDLGQEVRDIVISRNGRNLIMYFSN